jgi:hypothetical protein
MNNCNSEHFFNLIVDGYCHRCRKVYALGTPEEVAAREKKMRDDFARSNIKV